MNTFQRTPLFFILLGTAALLLPACGSKNVKSQKAPETVLSTETPVTTDMVGASDIGVAQEEKEEPAANSYVAKVGKKKSADTTAADTSATTAAASSEPAPSTPVESPVAPPQKTKSYSWLLWVIVAAALGGLGLLLWSKRQSGGETSQPMPPVGGLSPVSGFTAMKNSIKEDSENKPSFWSKKLF